MINGVRPTPFRPSRQRVYSNCSSHHLSVPIHHMCTCTMISIPGKCGNWWKSLRNTDTYLCSIFAVAFANVEPDIILFVLICGFFLHWWATWSVNTHSNNEWDRKGLSEYGFYFYLKLHGLDRLFNNNDKKGICFTNMNTKTNIFICALFLPMQTIMTVFSAWILNSRKICC